MIHVRVPEKLGKANNTTVEINHKRDNSLEQQPRLLRNSLAAFAIHRLVGDHLCSLETNILRAEEALKVSQA